VIGKQRLAKFNNIASARQEGVVVLEDIHDPHNAAAVLRSCEGLGLQKVYFIFAKEKKFNPEKIGFMTSASANKWLEYKIFTSAKDCYQFLHKRGYKVYATVLDEKAKSIFQTNLTEPKIALVFGNEHRGLSKQAVKLSDAHIYIPMQGFVQSFNLSVTVAVCVYEMFRQRQSKNCLLSKKEQARIVKRWEQKDKKK
jgi:tRNA (guanosine-2'-O-)-methyltransferase